MKYLLFLYFIIFSLFIDEIKSQYFKLTDITDTLDELSRLFNKKYAESGSCSRFSYFKVELLNPTKVYFSTPYNQINQQMIAIDNTTYLFQITTFMSSGTGAVKNFNLTLYDQNGLGYLFLDILKYSCIDPPVTINSTPMNSQIYRDRNYKGNYGMLVKNDNVILYMYGRGPNNKTIINTYSSGFVDIYSPQHYTNVYPGYTIYNLKLTNNTNSNAITVTSSFLNSNSQFQVNNFLNTDFKIPSIFYNSLKDCTGLKYDQCTLMMDIVSNSTYIFYLDNGRGSAADRPVMVSGNNTNSKIYVQLTNIAKDTTDGSTLIFYLYGFSKVSFSIILSQNFVKYSGRNGSPLNDIVPGVVVNPILMGGKTLYCAIASINIKRNTNVGNGYIYTTTNSISQLPSSSFPYTDLYINDFIGSLYAPQSLYFKQMNIINRNTLYFDGSSIPLTLEAIVTTPPASEILKPQFLKIEYFDVDENQHIIVRVHASDKGSGIQSIQISFYATYNPTLIQTTILANNLNLVQGDRFDGIYQFNIPKYLIRRYYKMDIIDYAGNFDNVIPNQFYSNSMYIPSFPLHFLGPTDIKNISFLYNDLSLGSTIANVMYITLTDESIKNLVFQFIPSFGMDTYRADNPSSGNEPFYTSKWNNIMKRYEIPFTIPASLPIGPISYLLNPIEIDSSTFYSYLGSSSELNVFTNPTTDIIGPIVTSIKSFGSLNIPTSGNSTIGFEFIITDDFNGIKQINITISSDLDPVGFDYQINPIGNPTTFEFSINITLYPDYHAQSYIISKMSALDSQNQRSEYPNILKVNPLMRFVENTSSITLETIETTPSTDKTPPVLDGTISVSQRVALNSRILTIEFTVKDMESGVSTEIMPLLYLIPDSFKFIVVPVDSFIVLNNSFVTFKTLLSVDCLFGYPNGFFIQVHRVFDRVKNFRGFNPSSLGINSFVNVSDVPQTININYTTYNTSTFLFGIYGYGFGISPTVQIKNESGGNNPIIMSPLLPFLNTNLIELNFSSIVNDKDQTLTIKVTNALGISSNEFLFALKSSTLPPTTSPSPLPTNPPLPCKGDPICGGSSNGICTSTGCVCTVGYLGIDCSSKVVEIDPVVNSTKPDVSIPYQVISSSTSMYSLRELDFSGQIVNEYIFENWTTNQENENTIHKYYATIFNKNDNTKSTNITVLIRKFDQPAFVQFANQNITMQPSSVKYYITITSYQFQQSLNTLELLMYASIETKQSKEYCHGSEFGDSNSQLSSQYIKVTINDISLYGEYIKRAIVDSSIKEISNKPLTELQVNPQSKNYDDDGNLKTFIAISIPHYYTMVELDPNFSVLLETSNKPSNYICKSSSGLTRSQLIGIIVGCSAFFIIVLIIICSILYRNSTFVRIKTNQLFKLKKINT